MNSIIAILEDNPERLQEFQWAVRQLGEGYQLQTWRDANRMIAECHEVLAETVLISLDHDLNKVNDESPDPSDGATAAGFLAMLPPCCPVILHTSNNEGFWSMHNEFRFGGWRTERVRRGVTTSSPLVAPSCASGRRPTGRPDSQQSVFGEELLSTCAFRLRQAERANVHWRARIGPDDARTA